MKHVWSRGPDAVQHKDFNATCHNRSQSRIIQSPGHGHGRRASLHFFDTAQAKSLSRLWRVEESVWLSESESMFSYDQYVFIMVFNLEFFNIPENLCQKN
jgi:hypothetical protein